MSFQVQPGAEGSLSESVHCPPTSSFCEHQGGYHMDGRMAMAPPLSSASRAPPRPPVLHEDGRGGGPLHYGGYDRPEYEYALRRHSCGDHLGLHSGNLIEQLLLQENQKALRIASIVQSQASGCLSGCLSCGNRSRFRDSEGRVLEEQRCYSRNVVGEDPSRSVNLEADTVEFPDGWFREPRPRQSIGERSQSRISISEDELGRSLCQGRRISYPVCHSTVSHSQASHHVQDHHLHSVGAAESSVPILGFSDGDGRVRQRRPTQRQSYSENGTEEDGWQRPSRSRVGPGSAREQDRLSLPGISTGSLPRTLVRSPHRPAGDSIRPPQNTRSSSQSLLAMPENSTEPSYQENALQQTSVQRLVTHGPISLTNWYLMKVQIAEVGRVLETKVAVGGWLVQNREHVKTSPIVNRLDIHKVVTEDGVEVILEGTMDQETSTGNGFSPGIVQCLSAGFPYMWKQLLRVRPVGESPSLAVSESLGGLHPKASKCLSEDESQGVNNPRISKTIPEDVPCSSRDCEGTSPAPSVNEDSLAIQNPANIASDAVGVEAAVTAGAETSDVVATGEAVTARAGTADDVETEAAVTATADTSRVVETEPTIPVRAESSDAIDERHSQGELLQQSCDVNPTSLDPAPATEAPLTHVTNDSLAKEAESGPITGTTLLTIRGSRKSKKEPSQPVRSSRRLQQRQSRSSEFALNLAHSLPPTHIEQVTSAMNITRGMSARGEPGDFVPDVEQATTGHVHLTKTDSIIEEVLKDLQQADTEAIDQDPMDTSADPQSMEVEVLGQTQDRCEYLSKDSDGFESHKSKEQQETIEDVLTGVEIEETISVVPSNLEIAQTVPVASLELEREEIEESAPPTPPELLQSNVQSRVDSLSKPSSPQELVFPETNARVTRSLKRRLKMSPATEANVLPVTRSLKRLRRSSDPVSNPDISLQEEGANVEAVSNPDTPLQEEVDAFHVRLRSPNSAKAVSCSNCKQPCSPQDLLKYNRNAASSEVTPEQVAKEELVDYAPLVPSQHSAEAHENRIETCSMKRRSGRFKNMKPATRFAKTGTSRRLIVGDSVAGPSEGRSKGILSRKGKGPSTGKGSIKGKGSRQGEGSIKGKGSRQGEGSIKGKGSRQSEGSSKGKESSEGEGFSGGEGCSEGEGSRKVKVLSEVKVCNEGSGLISSRGKNRRTSIIPPPLPPPRVQDKSKVPEAFGLKTSRSGRLLVPPLAYWRSQSIEYDKDGGIIAIFDGFQAKPADTGCFNFTPPQEKHAKRIQEKLCKAAMTVVKRK